MFQNFKKSPSNVTLTRTQRHQLNLTKYLRAWWILYRDLLTGRNKHKWCDGFSIVVAISLKIDGMFWIGTPLMMFCVYLMGLHVLRLVSPVKQSECVSALPRVSA